MSNDRPRVINIAATENSWNWNAVEQFLTAARQIEFALRQEKLTTQQLRDDLERLRVNHEQVTRDLETKLREAGIEENRARNSQIETQRRETEISERYRLLLADAKHLKSELNKYQTAWSEVLQREREAKMIIEDSKVNRIETVQLKAQLSTLNEQLEKEKKYKLDADRTIESYQKELQAALTRIHSGEARFNELFKELQVLSATKKSLNEEVKRVESNLQDRYEWALTRAKDEIRLEAENQSQAVWQKRREQWVEKYESELKLKDQLFEDLAAQHAREVESAAHKLEALSKKMQFFEGQYAEFQLERKAFESLELDVVKVTEENKKLTELVEIHSEALRRETLENEKHKILWSTEKPAQKLFNCLEETEKFISRLESRLVKLHPADYKRVPLDEAYLLLKDQRQYLLNILPSVQLFEEDPSVPIVKSHACAEI